MRESSLDCLKHCRRQRQSLWEIAWTVLSIVVGRDSLYEAAFTRWKLSRRLCAETWKKEQPSLVTVAVFFHTLETVVEKVAVNSCVCFVFLQLFFQNVKQKIWWWYFNLIIWKQDSVGLAPQVFTPACQQGKDVKSIQAFKIFNLKNKFYHVSL